MAGRRLEKSSGRTYMINDVAETFLSGRTVILEQVNQECGSGSSQVVNRPSLMINSPVSSLVTFSPLKIIA